MLLLNIHNVEECIFNKPKVRNLLPDLRHVFDQWLLSSKIPTLRSLRMRSLMDLINSLTADHIEVLENYFQDKIVLDKLDYHIIKDLKLSLSFDPDKEFSNSSDFGNFAISRKADNLYICFWR